MGDGRKELTVPIDGCAAALLAAPFEVGEAPFHIKGNAYRGHLEYVRKEIDGGLKAQADAMRRLHPERGDALATFMDQTFLASAWYDVFPIAIAGLACAKIVRLPFLTFVHRRSCVQAQTDITGVHRFLLKLVSAKNIAARVPMVSAQYFDFVQVEQVKVEKEEVIARMSGLPFCVAPWWAAVCDAYICTASELGGGRRPTIRVGPYYDDGEQHGVSMCSVDTVVTWPDA